MKISISRKFSQNMISSRSIFFVIFSLQLSTCVFATSNLTEKAQLDLKLLSDQIQSSKKLISETIPNVWNSYISSINETIRQGLSYDFGNYTVLLHNLTKFANIVTDGTDCVDSVLDLYLDLDNSDVNMVTNEKLVYNNLLDLASAEIDYLVSQFEDLETEFYDSCIINWNNCNGTSKFVIDEVRRLMLIARRIPFNFLSETHFLGYRLEADWATTQASINTEYHKVIQSVTKCLALKFENHGTVPLGVHFEASEEVETVFDAYEELYIRSRDTFLITITKLLSYSLNVITLGHTQYDSTIVEIQNAILKANNTVHSLVNLAQDLHITINCTKPNLNDVLTSSLARGLLEHSQYLDASTIRHKEGLDYLSTTVDEIYTIDFQVIHCHSTVECGSISQKLDEKITEIPSLLQGKGNASAVLQHQFITAIRESGHKIVRDVFDRLEAPIVVLKDCIRDSIHIDYW